MYISNKQFSPEKFYFYVIMFHLFVVIIIGFIRVYEVNPSDFT